MREELIKDLDNMEEILTKTESRCDIWQDRFIHAMAKALHHILTWIIRREDKHD